MLVADRGSILNKMEKVGKNKALEEETGCVLGTEKDMAVKDVKVLQLERL